MQTVRDTESSTISFLCLCISDGSPFKGDVPSFYRLLSSGRITEARGAGFGTRLTEVLRGIGGGFPTLCEESSDSYTVLWSPLLCFKREGFRGGNGGTELNAEADVEPIPTRSCISIKYIS